MNRRCLLKLLGIIVFMIPIVAVAQAEKNSLFDSEKPFEGQNLKQRVLQFEKKIHTLQKELQIPGISVAIVKNQEIIYSRGFGHANLEENIPATENTAYHIASLTKPFSAALIMQLVEEGRFTLDTPIKDILKKAFIFRKQNFLGYEELCEKIIIHYRSLQDYHCREKQITLRHHLSHTTQGKPGQNYQYHGFLYSFLTPVLESVSQKPFDELVAEKITGLFAMKNTYPNLNVDINLRILRERAKPYRLDATGTIVPSTFPQGLSASAGMVSTVIDLAKFDHAMDQNRIVSWTSKEKMFTPTRSSNENDLPYGLGWFIQKYENTKLVWHYGYQPRSYSSLILKVPKENITFILLANSDGASAGFGLGDGNVLRSPFAVHFINLFTKLEVTLSLPVTGVVKNVNTPDNDLQTYLSIVIGKGFSGILPDDIDTITVTGPEGTLPLHKEDFKYDRSFQEFYIRIPGSPKIGKYTFTVTSGEKVGSTTDSQSVLRTIPIPDTATFTSSTGDTLHSPVFSWGALQTKAPVYYRLVINELNGKRVYSTRRVKGMLSHTVPHGVLQPGQNYHWQIRAVDHGNWKNIQNRSHSQWQSFTMGSLYIPR